jgi:hypothetical protein
MEMSASVNEISELIREHRELSIDNRAQPRDPFFRPAKIFVGGKCHTALILNISDTGMGLMHDDALVPGPVQAEIEMCAGRSVRLDALLLWCNSVGNRFCSGARFLH